MLAKTDEFLERGLHITVAGLSRAAGVSRGFIYNHPDLRAEIERRVAEHDLRAREGHASRAVVTLASLRAENATLTTLNQQLGRTINQLEKRLGQHLGVQALDEIEDHERLLVGDTQQLQIEVGRLAAAVETLEDERDDLSEA